MPGPVKLSVSGSAVILSLLLVSGNFALDLVRRFDFNAEAARIDREQHVVEEETNALRLMLQELGDGRAELTEGFRNLEAGLRFLDDSIRRTAARNPEADTVATGLSMSTVFESDVRNSDSDRLETLLELSVEELDQRLTTARENSFFHRLLPHMRSLEKWDIDALIVSFETEYGFSLAPEATDLARLKFDTHRHAVQAVWSRYIMGLNSSYGEKILTGDYDNLAERGDDDIERRQTIVDTEESLAVYLTGSNRFVWSKNEHPELHRLDLLRTYLPVAALEEINHLFREGAEQ